MTHRRRDIPAAEPAKAGRAPMRRIASPERWRVDAGPSDVATLDIPPSAERTRRFEIDLRFVVRTAGPAKGAWHAMSVDLNGVRQGSRRSATHNPGQSDSLDYHCTCTLEPGQALRVRAVTQVGGALRERLVIEAEEEGA